MSVANNSYIDDSNEYDELFLLMEKMHFFQLLSEQESELVEDITLTLTTEQKNRLNKALNWGRERIDNALREVYQVSQLNYSTAPEVLKSLNARLAQWHLEKRRYRSGEGTSESWSDFEEELTNYATEKTIWQLDLPHQDSPVTTAVDSMATQFDRAGQFDNIIPSREDDDIWPDGRNEPS